MIITIFGPAFFFFLEKKKYNNLLLYCDETPGHPLNSALQQLSSTKTLVGFAISTDT